MAVISPSTFDPLRRYVSVRLAQGVPLADADWNEKDDARRWELRAFLRWFVGDGVPQGNDGFHVVPTGSATTFTIAAGGVGPEALNAGRTLVDGLEAFITADVSFDAQPLHVGQAGAAALAAAWGAPVIAAIPAPPLAPATRTLTVYLDVWERLVTIAEDPALVLAGLGTETCSRLRREWVVRVREGAAAPISGDPDFIAGHSYLALARITQDSSGIITAGNTSDRRRRGVSLPSQMDFTQVLTDTFGGGYAVDGTGVAKLAFPLRDVLNAILRERPAAVGPLTILGGGPHNTPTAVIDSAGIPWVFWVRVVGPNRFLSFIRRVDGIWTAPQDAFQITGLLNVNSVAGAAYPDGSIRIFYAGLLGNSRVFTRLFTGTWGVEEVVDVTDENIRLTATVTPAGIVVAGWQRTSAGPITTAQTRRYPMGAPAGPVESAGAMTSPSDLALTIDPSGAPQLVYVQTPSPIVPNWPVHQKRYVGAAWEVAFTNTTITIPVENFVDLTAGYAADGALWVFYATQGPPGFSSLRARRMVVGVTEVRELTPPSQTPRFPALVVDAQANALLFFQNGTNMQQVSLVQHI